MTRAQANKRLESVGLTWSSPAIDIIDELVEFAAELGADDPHQVADKISMANLEPRELSLPQLDSYEDGPIDGYDY